jgi:hypothetical protein
MYVPSKFDSLEYSYVECYTGIRALVDLFVIIRNMNTNLGSAP